MTEPESHVSRAEQRATAVAKLKRAASLPRMKDGRRPPMHTEAVSEGEKGIPPTPTPPTESSDTDNNVTPDSKVQVPPDPSPVQSGDYFDSQQSRQQQQTADSEPREHQDVSLATEVEVEAEADAETEDRSLSPGPSKSKRRRSRSRSRGSRDFKIKRGAPSPILIAGDSSPDEAPPMPIAIPILPPLFTPIPSPFAPQPNRFLASPDPSIFFGAPSSPSTPLPLPTLEAIQKGLLRSNSAGSAAASRRLALAKLTGGADNYEPSPSPTPPPLPGFPGRLARNNTVAGGERIAARQLMLGRLAGRVAVARETDSEQQPSGEERGAPSPNLNKKRRRRSRRTSSAANPAISDSDPVSTTSSTPLPPPTPYTISLEYLQQLRAASATPNQASSSRNQSSERLNGLHWQDARHGEYEHEPPEPHRRRSVLVEDDEDEEQVLQHHQAPRSRTPGYTPPPLPHHASPHMQALRAIHATEYPANHSTDSIPALNGGGFPSTAPLFVGRGSPARFDRFPSSPFTTPLKEKQLFSDDDEEEVLYPADTLRPRTPASATVPISDSRPRTPYGTDRDAYDRQISWVASPVPEINLPIDDDDGEDEDGDIGAEVLVQDGRGRYQEYDERPRSPSTTNDFVQSGVYDDPSSRISADTTSIVVESEASAEIHHLTASHFASIPLSQSASYSLQNGDQSQSTVDGSIIWEERLINPEPANKASVEGSTQSTWERVKNSLSRSTSSAGRRSRSNSIINRERNSSVSRESGVSLASGSKGERSDLFTTPPHQTVAPPLMQSPSTSTSILSVSPHSHMRGNPSPLPPVSDADRSKYTNDKLFPFPGMRKLEEQRSARARGGFPTASASTPDVSMLTGEGDAVTPLSAHSFNSVPHTPDHSRERKLSHQNSDSRLNYGYKPGQERPAVSPIRQGYIDLMPLAASTSSSSTKHKLPMSLTDVKQWLSKNKAKKASVSAFTPPATVALSPSLSSQFSSESSRDAKTPLAEVFQSNGAQPSSEWERRAPRNEHPPQGQTVNIHDRIHGKETPPTNGTPTDTERTPKGKKIIPLTLSPSTDSRFQAIQEAPVEPTKPERYMSSTPDATSSMSEFPAPTTSESSSASSRHSVGPTSQAVTLLQRLDDTLARGPVPVDEMPRKLTLSGPVLQVVNPNTVKDRFLFLFNDILIIAKPIIQDVGTLTDIPSTNPNDRKYIVKSVVRFRDLRFCQERTEQTPKSATPASTPRNPLLQSFVNDFARDPDHAIGDLFNKCKIRSDPSAIGQLLFKTQELHRGQLGEYLCRRNSKAVLKAFLDNYGFSGLRVDVALRIFFHSLHIPRSPDAAEYLSFSFANQWYDANAKSVPYDRDTAIRLVRAIGQLNELLHGQIADEVGPTGPPRRNITQQDFQDAFRRYDPGALVSNEFLKELYNSIYSEQLSQARAHTSPGSPGVIVAFKRPLPTRLTYKIQSDPIIIRLPQADPSFTLHLYGEDLLFEPPVLHFAKSPEASFRVTGTSLGTKTLVIRRSGPNAIKYEGLPLSYTIPVERAFMRNTFQIAFLNHKKVKRRYMFSVNDNLLRHQWGVAIRQAMEKSMSTPPPGSDNLMPGASGFSRAADEVAFQVLQETLTGPPPVHYDQNGLGSGYLSEKDTSATNGNANHRRSKSRSKLYPRQGAGRLEFDLSTSQLFDSDARDGNDTTDGDDNSGQYHHAGSTGTRCWTGREIALQCAQNSLIPAVLSYLQSTAGTF